LVGDVIEEALRQNNRQTPAWPKHIEAPLQKENCSDDALFKTRPATCRQFVLA
jgi:hypothetical protein